MRNFILLAVILLSFTTMSAQLAESYKGCCETELVSFKSEKGVEIIIPHFFTPNGDGVNDRFSPVYDPSKVVLENCTILNESRDTVLYNFGYGVQFKEEIPRGHGWGGVRYRHDSRDHKGSFFYSATFKIIGEQEVNLTGTACVIRCDKEDRDLEELRECLLDDDSLGELASEIEFLKEDECFEGK